MDGRALGRRSAAGKWLLGLEASLEPDLIHLNGYCLGALDWSAPLLIAGHSCLFSWYSAVKGFAPCKKEKRYHLAVAEGLRGADAVTAPTRAMLDALKAHYGQFCAAPAIYNGRNPAEFAPLMKKPLILSAGRLWDEAKNIKALSRVSGQVAWPIFVAGETRHPDGCFRNLTGVNCLGQLAPEILAQWMGRSAIYALPARYEPFGLSVLEAALAQCALVLGDIPSLRELWHGAALFVPPDDSRAVGKAITSLIEDRALRERLAAQAHKRAVLLTPQRMAKKYFALYSSLLHCAGNKAKQEALKMPISRTATSSVRERNETPHAME